MKVKQFRYSADNLGYLVYGPNTAVAIDAGAVNEMIAFAEAEGVAIAYVTNTHSHYDHTTGNRDMLRRTNAEFLDCRKMRNRKYIELDGEKLLIYHTPGHMDDCLTFHAGNILITGDTLFNGTVGTCFSGDMKGFLESINFLTSFPKDTLIYGGHDYVRESMAFAKTIDRDNPEIDRYLEKYDPYHIISTLEDEFKANPFVRYNDDAMITIMKQRGLPVETEFDRWKSLMDLY